LLSIIKATHNTHTHTHTRARARARIVPKVSELSSNGW